MYSYLVILQDNSGEYRKIHRLSCHVSNLLAEVNKICDKDCDSIDEISEVLHDVDWSVIVIDLETYEIVD